MSERTYYYLSFGVLQTLVGGLGLWLRITLPFLLTSKGLKKKYERAIAKRRAEILGLKEIRGRVIHYSFQKNLCGRARLESPLESGPRVDPEKIVFIRPGPGYADLKFREFLKTLLTLALAGLAWIVLIPFLFRVIND